MVKRDQEKRQNLLQHPQRNLKRNKNKKRPEKLIFGLFLYKIKLFSA